MSETMRVRRPRWRLPVIALFLLAPWTAECSWGGFTAAEFPFVVAILAPMYGGAAVLIREVARRTGGGWPAIVLLAAAFGVLQAGLVDQSLLNPGFLEDTEFRDLGPASRSTLIPGIEISAAQLLDYVGNHIALSICAPIAIVESLVREDRRYQPWLGVPGLVLVAVAYVGGSLLIYFDTAAADAYTPTSTQLGAVVRTAVVLIVAAVLIGLRPAAVRSDRSGPRAVHPLWVGALVASVSLVGWLGIDWAFVAVRIGMIAVAAALVVLWSRRPGWGQAHVLAAWGAGLVVAAGMAYLVPTYAPASPRAALIGDIAISVITATLLVAATLRLRRAGSAQQPRLGIDQGVAS